MKRLLILCALVLTTSCSDRAAEPRPIDQCEDAQAFRNWVSKAHPNVWHEYYATHCGDSL